MVIGVTGLIGSGKTTAAKMLGAMGASVIDADKIAHEVVEAYPELLRKLVNRFGKQILTPSGRLSPTRMAKVAFDSETARADLNRFTHPYIAREIRKRIRLMSRRHELVVVDAALLVGSEIESEMDFILTMHAGRDTRLRRLEARGMTRADAVRRMKTQLPLAVFRRRTDRIILNNGSPGDLKRKLTALYKKIQSAATGIG